MSIRDMTCDAHREGEGRRSDPGAPCVYCERDRLRRTVARLTPRTKEGIPAREQAEMLRGLERSRFTEMQGRLLALLRDSHPEADLDDLIALAASCVGGWIAMAVAEGGRKEDGDRCVARVSAVLELVYEETLRRTGK